MILDIMNSPTFCALIAVSLFMLYGNASSENQDQDSKVGGNNGTCARITDNGDGTVSAVGCPTYQCAPGNQTGYRKQDNSKPYPECCDGPICTE